MTIWEKAIINLEKGTKRAATGAALFSERVRAEIEIAKLRIRQDEVKSVIREQERIIGSKVVGLLQQDELPRTTEQLIKDETIVMALAEIAERERDLQDLNNEMGAHQAVFKEKPQEDAGV